VPQVGAQHDEHKGAVQHQQGNGAPVCHGPAADANGNTPSPHIVMFACILAVIEGVQKGASGR
jgi:hypothetical protein